MRGYTLKRKINTLPIKKFFKNLGPGLITGASDDDPSGIATYSQAGAQFGLATLWTALITFPLMFAIQEMCARIGLVTANGLVANIKKHYSKSILILVVLLMGPALIINIGANIASMGAVIHLLLPTIPAIAASIFFSLLLIVSMIALSYKKIVSILKYLCLSLFLYIIIPFITKQDFSEIIKNTFIPHIKFDKDFLSILVAILGTTISPYLFFWQTTMSAERNNFEKIRLRKEEFHNLRKDVGIGMLISNIVMYFIILTTGTVLFNHGISISTVEDAAKALEPLAGKLSYLLFSLGIIGTGFLSIPVLSGCLSYTVCTTFGLNEGLDKKFKKAKVFYLLIIFSILIGLGLNYFDVNPIKALIFSAILYGLVSPPLLLIILLIGNNKTIMGNKKNGKLSNYLGILTFVLMSLSGVLLVCFWLNG